MTEPTEPTEPTLAQQAAELTATVNELSGAVRDLAVSQRRIKAVVIGIVSALGLIVVLGIVLGFVAVEARQASRHAEQANNAARVTCESGNEARRVSRQLWTYVLDLSSRNPDQTPRQRQQIAQFRRYIATAYADRDCNAIPPTAETPTIITPTR